MSQLAFLSPDQATSVALWRSPLARAIRDAPPGVEDVSRIGKLEVRGVLDGADLPFEVVHITPERALLLCSYEECAAVREQLRPQFRSIVDLTGALAGLRVRGERLMRRLTDLDLDALPAAGAVARIDAIVIRDEGDAFRLFFPQEYADYVAAVVLDTLEGLPS